MMGKLDSIEHRLIELETRTVWRIDNLEDRVENLERKNASRIFPNKVWDRVLWAVLGLGVSAAGFSLVGVV